MKLPKKQCATCPFLPDGWKISDQEMARIMRDLMAGINHLCHCVGKARRRHRSNQTVCQGGRKWQLEIWHKMGYISAPTNEALSVAMRDAGVEPKEHIEG